MKPHDLFNDERWTAILRMFPQDLEESARACEAITRVRNIPSAGNLLRMVLAYAVSDLSLKDTAAWAKADGVANLTSQALHYRLMRSGEWLESLLGQLLFQGPRENRFGLPLRVVDGTVITGPGSHGTDWVLHIVLDPMSGRFVSFDVTDAHGAESFCRHTFHPGEIVLGDRMYATARGIESVVSHGAYPLVRVNLRTIKICAPDRQRYHLASLEPMVREKGPISLDILIPVPPDMQGRKSKNWDIKHASSWIPARIVGGPTKKGVVWVITTLTRAQMSDQAVLELYRLRWQVELLFKRLKSLLHLDDLPKSDGPISKPWILGRLLAAAIAQNLVCPTGLFPPG